MESLISHIDSVILKHYSNPDFNVTDLCKRVNKTQGYLYQVCMLHYNSRPSTIIENHRLNRALQLLRNDTLNLTQVAFQSGYKNYKTFSNAFTKRFKLQLSECRKVINEHNGYHSLRLPTTPESPGPEKSREKDK